MKYKQSGFTLIELMIVIAILGILVALAAPSFSRMIARSEVQTIVSEWRNSFYLAQKEAIRSKRRVSLCPSDDGENCVGRSDYSKGWIVKYEDNDYVIQDFPPTKGMDDGTLELSLTNNVDLTFLKNGRLPVNFVASEFQATHQKVEGIDVTLDISPAGNITVQ